MPSMQTPCRPAPASAQLLAGGLVYVNPGMPGIRRLKWGDSFRYRDAQGRWVRDADTLARIRSLAIPPAYTEVWICPLPHGHLQATGLDARGRLQYRYHPDWRALQDGTKFERLEAFGRALPRLRARVARDLRAGTKTPGRAQVIATLVRLLDTTLLRVGNEAYASSNGSFGLTTLRNRHAAVQGSALRLRFRGKSGVAHEARIDDPRVAHVVRQCQQLPGQALFQYTDEAGEVRGVSSNDVNDYIAEATDSGDGERFTAKDFRTWHGTVQALELTRLACAWEGEERRPGARDILAAVARQLGNTPAVCKKAYVHPAVLALGETLAREDDTAVTGTLLEKIAARAATTGPARGLIAAERRLLAFLRAKRRPAQPAARAKRTVSASSTTA
ncbi:DNA topoisomerase IB [Variovorax paradoxus]|uniref:DNA topoisomerase n=1 Tax=Variovorax paradoxus TaxID=34073 RepID=A0A5Q0M373_VARPD|nr:DNA topoisomerase IB [Variovorax paradoxus]QFZ83698.1 DNA topoisomerase IB [Variovorax paradoxus]